MMVGRRTYASARGKESGFVAANSLSVPASSLESHRAGGSGNSRDGPGKTAKADFHILGKFWIKILGHFKKRARHMAGYMLWMNNTHSIGQDSSSWSPYPQYRWQRWENGAR